MPVRQVVRTSKKQVAIGDLKHRVTLQNRSIESPDYGDADFDEDFKKLHGAATVWASVQPQQGKTIFDGVSQQDQEVTHLVYLRYDPLVTSETWIEFRERRFKILKARNYNEENRFLELACQEVGDKEEEASKS